MLAQSVNHVTLDKAPSPTNIPTIHHNAHKPQTPNLAPLNKGDSALSTHPKPHSHPRLLKSTQTKQKTAPVTLRERFCISLYYQFATMFTSLPGTTISLRIVLPSSDCAIASFAVFSSSSLSAAVGTFIRAFILPHS